MVEIASLGPGPFCAPLLVDMGADIARVDRAETVDYAGQPSALSIPPEGIPLYRGRGSLAVDLKNPDSVATVRRLAAQADVLLEGYRPGVMEKLGLGPEPCLADNPRLVYGRVSGYGQDGPLANPRGTTSGPCPKFSVSRTRIHASAPRISQHNAQVYGDLGLDAAALEALQAGGVV